MLRRLWLHIPAFAVRHRGGVLLAAAIGALAAALGASTLRPTSSLTDMLPDHLESVDAFKSVLEDFHVTDELLVVASTQADAAGTQLLRFAADLEQSLAGSSDPILGQAKVSFGRSPQWRDFIESVIVPHALLYADPDTREKVLARLTPQGMRDQLDRAERSLAAPAGAGQAALRAALQDPLQLRDFLTPILGTGEELKPAGGASLSPDGRHLLIRIRGARPATDLDYARALVNGTTDVLSRITPPAIRAELTGAYAIASFNERAIRSDLIRSISVSVALLGVLFLVAFSNWAAFPLALVPVGLGIAGAFALYAGMGLAMTPISAVTGAMLAGLAIDYCIHYQAHVRPGLQAGLTAGEAVHVAHGQVGGAIAAAAATSIVGFGAVAASDMPALRSFALLGVMGLALALVSTLVVTPALLSFGLGAASEARAGAGERLRLDWVMPAVARRRRAVLMVVILISTAGVGFVAAMGRSAVTFERDLAVIHPRPNPPVDLQQRVAELFGRPAETLVLRLQADSGTELIRLAHEAARTVEEDPGLADLVRVIGLDRLLPDPDRAAAAHAELQEVDVDEVLTSFDQAVQASVFQPDAFDSYRAFLRRLLRPGHPPGMPTLETYPDLGDTMLPKREAAEPDRWQALSLVEVERKSADTERPETIKRLQQVFATLPGVTLTGGPVLAHEAQRVIRSDLSRLLAAAGVLVFGWLLLYFRSATRAVLALLPAVVGLLTLLVGMDVGGVAFNMVNLVAVPILVGIGVDDGIFFVSSAGQARAEGRRVLAALQASTHAIVITSLSTMLTFGSLIFTSSPAIGSIGWLVILGVAGSLAGTFCLLGPLLLSGAPLPRASAET